MKKAHILALFIVFIGCTADNQYVVRGAVDGDFDNEWVYLVKFMQPHPDIDSSIVKNGKFTFKGKVEYPEVFVIHNNPDSILGFFSFYLEPARLRIDIVLENWTWSSSIKGGPINEEYNERIRIFENELVQFNKLADQKLTQADSSEQASIENERELIAKRSQQFKLDYISENPESPISPFLLAKIFAFIPFKDSEDILNTLSEVNRNTSICLSLQEKVDMMNKYQNGSLELE